MTTPLISCVVPVYNGERYLAATIDSVFAQTWPGTEVVVVDDGSTDGSAAVAAGYGERIRLLRQVNAGPAAARNAGLAAASGDLVALLDADDLWLPDKLALQHAFLVGGGHAVAFTHIQNFWIEELSEEAERFRDSRAGQPAPGYVSSTMMASRAAFDAVGPFNPAMGHGEVQDWVLRARERNVSIGMMPEILTRRRMHHANRSRQLAGQSRDEFLKLVKAQLDRRRGR